MTYPHLPFGMAVEHGHRKRVHLRSKIPSLQRPISPDPARRLGRVGIGHSSEVAAGGMAPLEFEPTCSPSGAQKTRDSQGWPGQGNRGWGSVQELQGCAIKCMKNGWSSCSSLKKYWYNGRIVMFRWMNMVYCKAAVDPSGQTVPMRRQHDTHFVASMFHYYTLLCSILQCPFV